MHKFPQDAALLSLTTEHTLNIITMILRQFWVPPHEMKTQIEEAIAPLVEINSLQVVVSGETKNISLYLISAKNVLAFTPFLPLHQNVLLHECDQEPLVSLDTHWSIFPADPMLLHRLSLPKVLLINPCVLENFPIPRLCLSIGLLGSYLRKYQKADVRLIDMQTGASLGDILNAAAQFQPSLIGMSVSYGQKQLALSILHAIAQHKTDSGDNPLFVLGNIIPASFPREFIEAYPQLVVARGEGEETILGLIEYLQGRCTFNEVPGIAYADPSGKVSTTVPFSVQIQDIPLPALDTIRDLAQCRGALTLELSRGCQWNVCTFCPREHKSHHWKTFTTAQIVEQFGYLREVCDQFGLTKHIFLADEEFVGGMNDGAETQRIIDVAHALLKKGLNMGFDAAARVDQVYSPKMRKDWHIQRMEMWHLCHKAGLDRLFMGIESGSRAQLRRYGKGIDAEHSIIAIRILSALGIPLRFGFITFDQLMIGLEDLKENIAFLERTDGFMQEVDVAAYGYEVLFDLLVHDTDFIAAHSAHIPVHAGISYMLASMEVLIDSRYKVMVKQAERRYQKTLILDEETPDTNMGRYRVAFVDDLIGEISTSSQKWIDRHFGLAYTVKSLYKVAPKAEKAFLSHWMVAYRHISFLLLKSLVFLFDQEGAPLDILGASNLDHDLQKTLVKFLDQLKAQIGTNSMMSRKRGIEACMNAFDLLVAAENSQLEARVHEGTITDTAQKQLTHVLDQWKEHTGVWTLINDGTLA